MEAKIGDIDWEMAAAEEKKRRHDVFLPITDLGHGSRSHLWYRCP